MGLSIGLLSSCGNSINPSATQVAVSTPPKIAHTKRNVLVVAVVLLLIIIVAGASYRPSVETVNQSSPTVVQTTNTPETQYDVVINFTERFDTSIDYSKASEGYTYLIVTLEIHNNVDTTFNTNPLDFYVTTNNVKYTLDFATYSLPDALKAVEVLKGGTVSGSIAFQVPKTSTDYQLYYEAPFTSQSINWVHYATTGQQINEQIIMESYNWTDLTHPDSISPKVGLILVLRNAGTTPLNIKSASIYLNDIKIGSRFRNATQCPDFTISPGSVCTLYIPTSYYNDNNWIPGTAYTFKIVTQEGVVFSYSVIAGEQS